MQWCHISYQYRLILNVQVPQSVSGRKNGFRTSLIKIVRDELVCD